MASAFLAVFILSYGTFWAIKKTIGLRVSEQEEVAGLDISSHGMYGYPEQFIPQPEFPSGLYEPTVAGTPLATSTPKRNSSAPIAEPSPQT